MNAAGIGRRSARVSFVTGLSTIVTIVTQLIAVPICLHYWGEVAYGRWLALFSTFMLLRSLDAGFTLYVGNKLNYLYHVDGAALHKHLASALVGIIVISALQLAVVGGALAFDPVASYLGITHHVGAYSGQLGLLILIVSWVLTGSYLGIVHRLLVPTGLMYQAAWWAMIFQIMQFLAIIVAAFLKLSVLQTSILFATAQFFIYVASALYIRHRLPEYLPWLRGMDIVTGLKDLANAQMLAASLFMQQGSTNGMLLMVSSLAGHGAVPMFATIRTLANFWTSVTTVLTGPLLPDIVRLHVKGEKYKLFALNQAFWMIVGSFVSLAVLLTYPLMPYVYGLWTTHAIALDRSLLCLMLASVVVANAGALVSLHLNGINSLRIILLTSIVKVTFSLGIGVFGYARFGISSFGIGMLVGELSVMVLSTYYFINRVLIAEDIRARLSDCGPITLNIFLIILFFIGTGFEFWSGPMPWLVAVFGVSISGLWGWRQMNRDLRARFLDSIFRLVKIQSRSQ